VRQDRALAVGYVTAAAGPLAAVSLLSVFREQPLSIPAVVLVLIVVIVVAAALAGPVAAFTATLTAALSFDFLFVSPYRVLKLGPIEEVWPVGLLLAAGVSIGSLVRRRWPYRDGAVVSAAQRVSNPSLHVQRVVLLIEQGADGRDLIAAVQAELTGLLVARSCRFDAGQDPSRRPRLERDGTVSGYGIEPALPATELELPVQRGRHRVGSFVIDPTPGVTVPFDHRIVAVILTDHLAAALAARKPAPPRV
jgi:K+-sensing histidine kinase KdpD